MCNNNKYIKPSLQYIVAATFPQRWGKVVKTLAHQVAATFSRKLQECCHNLAAKRCKKTCPQLYGNIHSM